MMMNLAVALKYQMPLSSEPSKPMIYVVKRKAYLFQHDCMNDFLLQVSVRLSKPCIFLCVGKPWDGLVHFR
jgi:hypothetical protein